jgi:hypothetical protein
MKKAILLVNIVTILVVFASFTVFADEDSRTVEEVMELIRIEQGVSDNRDINPDKVSNELLEELGEALMTLMHPYEPEHEWMENMMGGEDPESLNSMLRFMGYRYLTGEYWYGERYWHRGPYRGHHGMMGGGWMNPWINYNSPVDNQYGCGFFFPAGAILFGILITGLVAAVIVLSVLLARKRKNNQAGEMNQ